MTPAELLDERQRCLASAVLPSAAQRAALVEATDAWVRALAREAGLERIGAALVAVGGYGRGELAPRSDLDLVLVHGNVADAKTLAAVADAIWYPIWDAGIALDHSVRTLPEARALAAADVKVALGLLDARCVAGDADLAGQLHTAALADWRAKAGVRLPELHTAVRERVKRAHEVAHLLEPDLKESYGGLRDVALLRAIAATWLTDYDHAPVDAAAALLMGVRDALHRVTGRSTDRLALQEQSAVAQLLGYPHDDALLRAVFDAGRAVAAASDLTWHRVQRLTRRRPLLRALRPAREAEQRPLVDGVFAQNDEVFLTRDARPDRDPTLLLRAAAAAAQAGLPLAPETVSRLADNATALPQPWPRVAREALVSLLGAGPAAIPVWEALDNAGCLTRLLPEWEGVRSLPQRNALHLYTVDRHQVETATRAAADAREVSRPDLLLIAALFHDIGKGRGPNHSETGAVLMAEIATSFGYSPTESATLVCLVRHHLLLAEAATRRDPDDPATVQALVDAVGSHETLDLLHALTKADSQAAAPGVWNEWKARLVLALVERVHAALAGAPAPEPPALEVDHAPLLASEETRVVVDRDEEALRIVVATEDRIGLLATVAGALSLLRLDVRAARIETVGCRALQEWIVLPEFGEAPSSDAIGQQLRLAISGQLDVAAGLAQRRGSVLQRRGFLPPAPRIRFIAGASERADVLEVRVHDAPALLWRVSGAVAEQGVSVTHARVETLGSDVIDVLYLVDATGARLDDQQRAAVLAAVAEALP